MIETPAEKAKQPQPTAHHRAILTAAGASVYEYRRFSHELSYRMVSTFERFYQDPLWYGEHLKRKWSVQS